MSKVLVTGANGFVGKHLLNELVNNGYEVLAIGGSQEPVINETDRTISYMTLDLTNPSEADKIDFSDISGVVHLAGLAAVGPSFDEPMKYIDVNIGLEINLFQAAISQNAKPRFIIVSSGTLYDPKADLPLSEGSPVLPNSPYAVSKIGQEEMSKYYSTRGFEVIIVRPFNHVGPGQKPGFIVADLCQQIVAVEKGEKQNIGVGNLDAKRDYTDVRDIVRAYRMLLEDGTPGETYNICSGKALDGHQILQSLLNITDTKPQIIQDQEKMRPSDTPLVYGSHEKITKDSGWEPQIDIETTLKDALEDWRNN